MKRSIERKILNKILCVGEAYAESDETIKQIAPNAYLNTVLLDLSKYISIEKLKFLYYEKLSNTKGYNNYIVEIDNLKMEISCCGKGFFTHKHMEELSNTDPLLFPPRKLDIEKVTIDFEQLVQIALNEPPHFVPSEMKNISNLDASLFVKEDKILWRFLCENSRVGFRTLHVDAERGNIVYNKLDKIYKS